MAGLHMKPQVADTKIGEIRKADKRLYLGLFIVGVLFLTSYSLEATSLAESLGLGSFTQLPDILSFTAKALLLVHLTHYILSELSSDESS